MSDDLVKVTVSEGKYTFGQRKDGSCYALRYGEPWREDIFDGLTLAMAHHIEVLEAAFSNLSREYDKRADRIEELEAKLAKAVEERDEWQSLAEAAITDDAAKNIHYAEIQTKLATASHNATAFGHKIVELEANLADAAAALKEIFDGKNWRLGQRFDPNSGNFDLSTQRKAYIKIKGEQL